MKLFSLSSICLTGLLVSTAAADGRLVWSKPCYYSDNCERYEFTEGFSFQLGQCVNLGRGMSSYAMWGSSACQFFNEANCGGRSVTDYAPNVWYNSNIGWLWSFKCT